jgi:acetyl-CoA acetyltransferase
VRDVHIVGAGATSFSGGERDARRLVREAGAAALADAGLTARDIGAVALVSEAPRPELAQELASRVALVSGPTALHLAWQDVASGARDVVLCVGHDASREQSIDALAAGAERYMEASGATEAHFARVAAKNRRHGVSNPRALLSARVGADEVLASELLTWPLRRLMVAPPAEAAAAVVLASADMRRRMGADGPSVRASVVARKGVGDGDAAAARAARLAYQMAALGPEDLDCAEIDDRTAASELAAYEALLLAPEGRGPDLVDSGFTALGGVLPVNTSGGALSQGDAGSASAVAQLCELAWQLRGEAGRRQVAGAHVGLALQEGSGEGESFVSLTILGSR